MKCKCILKTPLPGKGILGTLAVGDWGELLGHEQTLELQASWATKGLLEAGWAAPGPRTKLLGLKRRRIWQRLELSSLMLRLFLNDFG